MKYPYENMVYDIFIRTNISKNLWGGALRVQTDFMRTFEANAKCNNTLQAFTGPVQGKNRIFPVKFSTQGKTFFHYRELLFSLQGPLFSLQGFPLSFSK